jgi:exopolysaccharide biosynthesis polyprenyl glycosylphosphotransferase
MFKRVEAHELRNVSSRSLHQTSKSFRERGLLFFLTDSIFLLGTLTIFGVLRGKLDIAAFSFIGSLMVLQFGTELRHPQRTDLSALEDATGVFRRVCAAYAFASVLALVLGSGDLTGLVVLAVVSAPLLPIGRSLSYAIERSRRRKGRRSRAVIVGGGEVADRVISTSRLCPEFGLDVVGSVEDDRTPTRIPEGGIIGTVADLPQAVHSHRIDTVIVAFSAKRDSEMTELIRELLSKGTAVWVIPRFYEFGIQNHREEDMWGLPVVRLAAPGPARAEWPLKRAFDVVAAAIAFVVVAPLIALTSALIWIESGRPVLFRQQRVGAHGRTFEMLKLRTMSVSSKDLNDTEWVADGGRATKIGKVLRTSGLDELPQLLNVLRGDMSLVGPRPERPFFVERFTRLYPRYEARHRVAGGITGWSQIRGLRGDTPISHRTAGDNHYIDTWSFSRDLKIVLRSVPTLIRGRVIQHSADHGNDPFVPQTTGEVAASTIVLSDSSADPAASVGRYGLD